MSRKVWIVLALFASLGLVVFGVWSGRTQHHISRDGFERLCVGMTEDEVEAVLGRPAGDYSTGVIVLSDYLHVFPYSPVCPAPKQWTSNEAAISVCFDGGRVVHTDFSEVLVIEESLPNKLRRWLRL